MTGSSLAFFTPHAKHTDKKKRKDLHLSSCGADGTRTRDPMRDRHVF